MSVPLPELVDVDWSIMIIDADTGAVLAQHDARRVLRTASVGKIFLLSEVARQVVAGGRSPTDRVSWTEEDFVADSGLWHRLDQRSLSLHDACLLIGAVSDNLATNAVLRVIGLDAVAATTAALGCRDSALLDRVRTERGPADPPTLSRGTAAEIAQVMRRLHTGELVGFAESIMVRDWLAAGTDLSMVAAAFGLDPLAHSDPDRGVTVINKTGTISTARIDVGLVTGPAVSVAYAVLANWTAAEPDQPDPRDAVLDQMRGIGGAIRAVVHGLDGRL